MPVLISVLVVITVLCRSVRTDEQIEFGAPYPVDINNPGVKQFAHFAALQMDGGATVVEIKEAAIQKVSGWKYFITMDVDKYGYMNLLECHVQGVDQPDQWRQWITYSSCSEIPSYPPWGNKKWRKRVKVVTSKKQENCS